MRGLIIKPVSLILRKNEIFYGWIIVAACAIIASTLMGTRFSYGIFFKSIQGEFDLTRTVTSSIFSAYVLVGAVFSVLGGWAIDKYGPRPIVFLMGLFTGGSLIITSQTSSLWQIYLSYSLLLAAGTGAVMPVLISTISKWFNRKRGLAIGINSSGGNLGTLIMAPLAASLITNFSWRTSYIVMGLVALLIIIPVSRLLRKDPKEIGALPDGINPDNAIAEAAYREEKHKPDGLSLREAFRTRNLWLILLIHVLFALCTTLIITHVVPYATDSGIPIVKAATIISVMSGSGILASILIGRVSDIVGRKVPSIICAFTAAGALMWLTQAESMWMFYLFAILYGLSSIGLAVVALALASDIFGVRSLGKILSAIDVGFAVGAAIGPTMGGLIFDATGSYFIAFATAAAAMLIIALFLSLTSVGKGATAPADKQ